MQLLVSAWLFQKVVYITNKWCRCDSYHIQVATLCKGLVMFVNVNAQKSNKTNIKV